MKFEEKFPSLKDKVDEYTYESERTATTFYEREEGQVNIKDIEFHCIDKQKVRDAIWEVKKWEHCNGSEDWEIELFRKLHLGDEE